METTHESSNQTLCSAQPAKPYAFSRKVFCEGMRDGVPIALGYFAVSFSLGIAARTAGFTPLQGKGGVLARRSIVEQAGHEAL